MRTHHTHHPLNAFPVYSAAFVADDRLVLGGGGGSSRSGIKNKLRLYKTPNDATVELLSELELEKDEDAPMSMAADIEGSRIVCGINSSTEQLEKGINKNCRTFSLGHDKFELGGTASTLNSVADNPEDYQKVTALSPGGTLVAVAGTRDLSVLSSPSLNVVSQPLHLEHDIYDATFSSKYLIVATTDNLLVYSLPLAAGQNGTSKPAIETRSKKKQRQKPQSIAIADLSLVKSLDRPKLSGSDASASTFRAVRFHPSSHNVLYTVQNTAPPRTRSRVSSSVKQGFVCRWNTDSWEVVKMSKAGSKGITCFDVSPNGKFLAFGSADCSIGLLDAQTLAPLLMILKSHEFPPTVIRFNPSSKLLVSGSPDNSVRLVAVPESLAGTTWTTLSVAIVTFILLLMSILIAYVLQTGPYKL